MEEQEPTTPTRASRKRVSFGGVTVIAIPRRGKFSLSLPLSNTLDETPPQPFLSEKPQPPLDISSSAAQIGPGQQQQLAIQQCSSPALSALLAGAEAFGQCSASPALLESCSSATPTGLTALPSYFKREAAPAATAVVLGDEVVCTISSDALSGGKEEEATIDDSITPLGGEEKHCDEAPGQLNESILTAVEDNHINIISMLSDSQLGSALDEVLGLGTPDQSIPCSPVVTTVGGGAPLSSPSAARCRGHQPRDDEPGVGEDEDGRLHLNVARRLEVMSESCEEMAAAPSTLCSGTADDQRVCVFCQRREGNTAAGKCPPAFTAVDGHSCHVACALWCPEVFYDVAAGTLKNVGEAVARSAHIKCAYCRKTGAAVGCVRRSCQLSYHLPCAHKAHAELDRAKFQLRCPIHTADPKKHGIQKNNNNNKVWRL